MRTYEFKVAEWDVTGEAGLCPTWMGPNAFPLDGTAAAHDILEHGPEDDGSPEAEFMAIGALFYVRGYDYFAMKNRHNPDPAWQAHGELWEQYRYITERGDSYTLRDPGRTTACDEEDTIDRMISEGVTMCRGESSHDVDDAEAMDRWLSDQNLKRMRGWMRKGYRRAVKRYHSRIHALDLFLLIEREAGKYAAEEYLGLTIKVKVDLAHGRVQVPDPLDEMENDY